MKDGERGEVKFKENTSDRGTRENRKSMSMRELGEKNFRLGEARGLKGFGKDGRKRTFEGIFFFLWGLRRAGSE